MEKSRLYKLFLCLEAPHLRDLKKFIRSPFYNKRADVIKLFDLLVEGKNKKRFSPNKLQLFNKIFGDVTYDDNRMRLIMTLLHQLIDKYLVQESIAKDSLPGWHPRLVSEPIWKRWSVDPT